MKKALPIILIIAFLSLILQVAVTIFITDKQVSYVLKIGDNKYEINEHLNVVDNVSYYDFSIIDSDGNNYVFSIDEDFNKQTEIIKDIKYFKENDVSCIFPMYKRDISKNVSCLYKDEAVSYSYLKQIGNEDIDNIVDSLITEKYKHNSWNRTLPGKVLLSQEGRSIEVYQENILEDYIFLIWRYKGLYILKNEESIIKDYLGNDQYDNSLSALVGKYYVTAPVRGDNFRISELSYYNTKDLGKGNIVLEDATSSDFYFNGVYKKKLYMTDVGNKKQYAIEPAYEKVEEVGNPDDKFINVVDGKIVKVDAASFLANKVYFNNDVENEEISSKYGENLKIVKDRAFYYFKTADGAIYRSHEENPAYAELLFKFDNLVEWKVDNGDVMAVAGNTVYFYNDREGLMPIAINNELNYNHKNIVDFWKE